MDFSFDYFDKGLDRVGSRCEKWDGMEKEYGKGILPLWVADMDFPSPPAVEKAISKRAAHPTYGYTEILDDDYQAVISFWQRRHNTSLHKENITLLPCVVTGLKACVQAFTSPGDGVVIQTPVYGPFYGAVEANDRKVIENPLIKDEDGRYHMDLAHLEGLLQNGAKLVMICSPHNPVSRAWSRDEMEKLLALLDRYHTPLVVDEIHADFVFKPDAFVSALSLHMESQVITLAAASKTFNLAGLQQACLFTRNEAIHSALKNVLNQAGVRSGNIFALEGTRAAYNEGDQWLDGLMEYLDKGRKLLDKELAIHLPSARLTPIDATYLAWIDMSAYGFSTEEMMTRTHQAGVAFTEGTFFGKDSGEGYLRFNFGCPHRNIVEGVQRLKKAILGE